MPNENFDDEQGEQDFKRWLAGEKVWPETILIANDLYKRGLIEKGVHLIEISW